MQGPMPQSKRASLKTLFTRIFRSGQTTIPDSLKISSNYTNLFPSARGFVVNNPTFNVQGERDIVTQAMKALYKRIIDGAEYDSSARDPPPRCHPGTRVELIGRINTWFHSERRQKALLWLNGPAGVGKSAVIQTFAESLATSNCLGATLFFSRPNDRKDPQRVFVTLAFQLATRIPTYRSYVAEQVALNPSLLKKGMKEQFQILIAEPFGSKGIESGGGPWGVLLDGLDECEGVNQQCEIVQLISDFVLKFPHAPLVWTIASRPEPHIVATFNDEVVAPSCWLEYIPINSTEACQDVERYFNASFKVMRKRFSHVPPNWPSETQFLKLANGALGLFIFARTAVRFMEDPDHADPVSRLNLLLSVIDHLDIAVTDEHPFALLDALYTQIVTSIPPILWRTTKRVLGFTICARWDWNGFSYPMDPPSLLRISIILDLEQGAVYSSLHKLHSVLEIPPPKRAHKSRVSFLHASFSDYLTDPARSGDFSIDRGESVDDITCSLFKMFLQKPWDANWARYTSQMSRIAGRSFYRQLKKDAEHNLHYAITGDLKSERGKGPFKSQQDRSECLDFLSQVNTAEFFWLEALPVNFTRWLFELWAGFSEELESRGLCKEVSLEDVKVDHLDYRRNKPIRLFYDDSGSPQTQSPGSSHDLQIFTAELQSLRLEHPGTHVLICGSTPEKRNAFFSQHFVEDNRQRPCYYCIPCPH